MSDPCNDNQTAPIGHHRPPLIAVFDSGVGGISILSEIRRQLPLASFGYIADTEFFPYGTKNDDVLVKRIVDVCQQAVSKLRPDLLVLACNTASTLALTELRQHLNIPVVGVVPAIKVAAELSTNQSIGLLATEATVNRPYIDDLHRQHGNGYPLVRFGSRDLVAMAEEMAKGIDVSEQLKAHLHPWLVQHPNLTHVVLGCTHFPLLRPLLEDVWPHIKWIDSGAAIARRVSYLLSDKTSELVNTDALTSKCPDVDHQTSTTIHLLVTCDHDEMAVKTFLSQTSAAIDCHVLSI